MSAALAIAGQNRASLAGISFQAARIFLLCLLIIMPWEAITAAREIALAGSALLLAIHLWLSPGRELRATALFLPLAIYTAVAALSLIWAMDVGYSLKEFRAEVIKGLVLYYTGVHFIQCREHLGQAWGALLTGVAIMGIAGVILFFLYGGSLLGHQVRAGSLHNGYGGLGTYLVTVWPFVLLAPLAWRGSWARPWLLALIPLTALLTYLTFSRAAWLGVLVETGLVFMMLSRRRLKVALLGLVLLLAAAAAVLFTPGWRHGERWNQLWSHPEAVGGTAGDLAAVWGHSVREIAKSPLSGIGLGRHSFSKAFPEFRAAHQPLLWHSHNMFLEAALQMGLQGLAALLLIMAVLIVCLWPHAPPVANDTAGLFGAAMAAMVVGFAVRNFTDDFFVDDSAFLFWLLAGLAMGGAGLTGSRRRA